MAGLDYSHHQRHEVVFGHDGRKELPMLQHRNDCDLVLSIEYTKLVPQTPGLGDMIAMFEVNELSVLDDYLSNPKAVVPLDEPFSRKKMISFKAKQLTNLHGKFVVHYIQNFPVRISLGKSNIYFLKCPTAAEVISEANDLQPPEEFIREMSDFTWRLISEQDHVYQAWRQNMLNRAEEMGRNIYCQTVRKSKEASAQRRKKLKEKFPDELLQQYKEYSENLMQKMSAQPLQVDVGNLQAFQPFQLGRASHELGSGQFDHGFGQSQFQHKKRNFERAPNTIIQSNTEARARSQNNVADDSIDDLLSTPYNKIFESMRDQAFAGLKTTEGVHTNNVLATHQTRILPIRGSPNHQALVSLPQQAQGYPTQQPQANQPQQAQGYPTQQPQANEPQQAQGYPAQHAQENPAQHAQGYPAQHAQGYPSQHGQGYASHEFQGYQLFPQHNRGFPPAHLRSLAAQSTRALNAVQNQDHAVSEYSSQTSKPCPVVPLPELHPQSLPAHAQAPLLCQAFQKEQSLSAHGFQPFSVPEQSSLPVIGFQSMSVQAQPALGFQPMPKPCNPSLGFQPMPEPSHPALGSQPMPEPSHPALGFQPMPGVKFQERAVPQHQGQNNDGLLMVRAEVHVGEEPIYDDYSDSDSQSSRVPNSSSEHYSDDHSDDFGEDPSDDFGEDPSDDFGEDPSDDFGEDPNEDESKDPSRDHSCEEEEEMHSTGDLESNVSTDDEIESEIGGACSLRSPPRSTVIRIESTSSEGSLAEASLGNEALGPRVEMASGSSGSSFEVLESNCEPMPPTQSYGRFLMETFLNY